MGGWLNVRLDWTSPANPMSALGHQRTFGPCHPPIAEVQRPLQHVRFVPIVLQSPKTPRDRISAKRQNKRQPSIDVASNAPPKSPVSSSQNEVVPHINIRSPRLQPGKFVIGETKRLLQQYLPEGDSCTAANMIVIRSPRLRGRAKPPAFRGRVSSRS